MEEATKDYELLCILSPGLEGVDLDRVKNEIADAINKLEGTINFKESSKKSLAYPINKEGQGIYLISQISITPDKLINFSKELKLNKQVLRHLMSSLENIKAETEKPRTFKKPAAPKKTASKKEVSQTVKSTESSLQEIDKKLDELIGEI